MATDIIIYHNPACGTSRNTLAMIRHAGIEPHVIEYLKTPPSRALLEQLIALQSAAAKKAAQPATPVEWEYKSIFGDSRVALEEEMNAFGKEGWEFFNITSFGRGSAAFARMPVK